MNQIKNIIKLVYDYFKDQLNLKNHWEYKLLWEKYHEYNWYVKTGKKTFDVYIIDSKSDLEIRLSSIEKNEDTTIEKKKSLKKIMSIFELGTSLIQKYFELLDFNLKVATELIREFDSTTRINQILSSPINNIDDLEIKKVFKTKPVPLKNLDQFTKENQREKIVELSKEKAKYYLRSPYKYSHMATRIGGYLFVCGYLVEPKTKLRKQIWENHTGYKIGETIYLTTPSHVKSSRDITLMHLNDLKTFFESIEANDIVAEIQKDINKLNKKQMHLL